APPRAVYTEGAAAKCASVICSTTWLFCESQARSMAANTRRSANLPAPPRITHFVAGIHATPIRGLTCRFLIPRKEGSTDASNRVAELQVPLVVRVVAPVGRAEVGDTHDRDPSSLLGGGV